MAATSIINPAALRLLSVSWLCAVCVWPALAEERVSVTLGDYKFEPAELTLKAGQTVVLELVNADGITPHNFTLNDTASGLDIDIDVAPGASREVVLTPLVSGSYGFYCNKKLPFLKSHRARGMEGALHVVSP